MQGACGGQAAAAIADRGLAVGLRLAIIRPPAIAAREEARIFDSPETGRAAD